MKTLFTFLFAFIIGSTFAQVPVTVDDVSYPRINVSEFYGGYNLVTTDHWYEVNDVAFGTTEPLHRFETSYGYGVASAGYEAPILLVNSQGNDIILSNGEVYCFKTLVPPGAMIATENGGLSGAFDALYIGTTIEPSTINTTTNTLTDVDGNEYGMSLVSDAWMGTFNMGNNDTLPNIETVAHYRYHTFIGYEDTYQTDEDFWFRGYQAYIVVLDSALYNTWVRAGYPMADEDECLTYDAGEITASAQLLGGSVLSSVSDASGSPDAINYIWQECVDGNPANLADENWQAVSGENAVSFTIPYSWTETTYVRRVAMSGCGIIYSNIATISDETTNINSISENNIFTIYPNPASTTLIVESKELKVESLQILDITGKIVKQYSVSSKQYKVYVADLQNGVYFIKLGTQVQKFIKE